MTAYTVQPNLDYCKTWKQITIIYLTLDLIHCEQLIIFGLYHILIYSFLENI